MEWTALGDIQRTIVKGWVNKTLRPSLGDRSVKDVLILFSMILGEAVDEGMIGANPCRKLRLTFDERPERPRASAHEVNAIVGRMTGDDGLLDHHRRVHRDPVGRTGRTAMDQDLPDRRTADRDRPRVRRPP